MEGLDPSSIGRVGRDVVVGRCCWKAWKRRQLEGLEGTLDPDVSIQSIKNGVSIMIEFTWWSTIY